MPRPRPPILRVWLALALVLGQLLALAPAADAQQTERIAATFSPKSIGAKELVGVCPVGDRADAPCPVSRGQTYTTTVTVSFDQAVQPMVIEAVGNGLDIVATSHTTGADITPALSANQAETLDIAVTVPESSPRNERNFYLGKISLVGGGSNVAGGLTVSLTIPKPRISWGRLQVDDNSGDSAPLQSVVGSGASFTYRATLTSSMQIEDFAVRANSARVTVSGAPTVLPAGEAQALSVSFNAPIVNKKTRMDVNLIPASGITPVGGSLRMRVIVLPATVAWGPPLIRATLNAEEQKPLERTLTITSNYDIPNVEFKTQDVGLTPILSPTAPVDLKAGKPQQVKVRLCPGYAPTTYFLGLTAYQGSKPLNQRLQIRMTVQGDAAKIKPLPEGAQDPCAAP